MTKFSTPRGTQDILPDEWPWWDLLLEHIKEIVDLFGYSRIETPNFAETGLFSRTSGESSDVVEKEMYTFRDRGGDELTLRPEGTAPVMRAYLQHGMQRLPQPLKLYYIERMYRYDRPQRGRFREHHQFGCEAIGVEDAFVDVEMISLLDTLFKKIGFDDYTIHINSIGDQNCRPGYVADLVAFLRGHEQELAQTDQARVVRNPLRVLDSKERQSQQIIEAAPPMLDYLCAECRQHWNKVRHGLEVLGIPVVINPRLVRGLDYYTRTAFEFVPAKEGSQAVLAGGGRYDGLSEAMGGPPVPGIGFGSGMERIVLGMQEAGVALPEQPRPLVFVISIGQSAQDLALRLTKQMRDAHIRAEMAFGEGSMKSQMKKAGASGARFALIVHEEELLENRVTLRDLVLSEQKTIGADEVLEAVRRGRNVS